MAEKDREQALKKVINEIDTTISKGAIMRLGDDFQQPADGISTGALSLDLALGGRGLPRRRIIEIFGNESSGKTTLALHAVASAQKDGGVAAYIDVEHALDPAWARRLGVDLENLLVSQPEHGEEALRIVELLVKSNAVDIIVVDSVAALVPKAEFDGEIGQSHVGLQARLMSQALRILNPSIAKMRTCLIFINQIRQKVGVFFGSPETTSGGLALKFYSSVRIEVKKGSQVKKGDEVIGNEVKAKVVKNKVAPPFRQATFELLYDAGISREGDVLLMAIDEKLIEKKSSSSSYLYYGDIGLGNGHEKARDFLKENPAVVEELIQKILLKRGFNQSALVPVEAAPAPAPPPAKEGGRRKQAASSSE